MIQNVFYRMKYSKKKYQKYKAVQVYCTFLSFIWKEKKRWTPVFNIEQDKKNLKE